MALAAPARDDGEQQAGQLVFQKSKKLHDEFYIVDVRDSAEAAALRFSAFDLETSETHHLTYSYADFDALFKSEPELANSANKEGRYNWVIDRLDIAESAGGPKRLALSSEPTDEGDSALPLPKRSPRAPVKPRLSYAERVRLRKEAEKLEEKRAANVALKSERNRKAFVEELSEKRKLEELKQASRKQRIDEERAMRREKAEMQRHLQEEKAKRYEENDRKREERIQVLEAERAERDRANIQEILQTAKAQEEAKEQRLEEARQRKAEEEAAQAAAQAAKHEADRQLDERRESRIAERAERLKVAEREYLEYRKQQIDLIAREKQEKEERKKEYLREKAVERATALRVKHEKIEAWERLDDQRTQNNMKKEHARNMLMVDHIENLRQKYSQELADAAVRKREALEQRKVREAKEAAISAEESKKLLDLALKRDQNIAEKMKAREEKNQKYCQHIRDLKTSEATRVRDQREQVESAKERSREERSRERQMRVEQDQAAAQVAAQREENIRRRERERDLKFAQQVREVKDKETKQALEQEARKTQKRLQEREEAEKRQEEELQRRRQMALLDEQRDAMIHERAQERNKREQERLTKGREPVQDLERRDEAAAPAAITQSSAPGL